MPGWSPCACAAAARGTGCCMLIVLCFGALGVLFYLMSQDFKDHQNHYSDHNFTLVSALIDIGRENWTTFNRSFEDYLHFAKPLLNIDCNLVLFVDKKVKDFVKRQRRDKLSHTVIHSVGLNDLEYYKDYGKIKKIMRSKEFRKDHPLRLHPEAFSPAYNLVVNSKPSFVYHTALRNPFNTTYFYWIDFGYGHGNDIFPHTNNWSPWNIMDDSNKITYIKFENETFGRNISSPYKKFVHPLINGGFFGGSKSAITQYHELHKDTFHHFLNASMMDDDQTMAVECYLRNPDLFNLVQGDWNDVFRLFH